MSIKDRLKNSKLAEFWLVYEKKIVLAVGIILIAALSCEAGYLHGQKNKQESVIVNKAACAPCPKGESADMNKAGASTSASQNNSTTAKSTGQPNAEKQNCTYVASKNSNKYHLSTCQFAQKIKPEYRICFSSAEEAAQRGYQGAKCCIK